MLFAVRFLYRQISEHSDIMENSELKEFQTLEESNKHNASILQAIEMELDIILAPQNIVKNRVDWLLYRNLFRVRNARHMKLRKPRIFLGTISFSDYPNFQIYPFLNFADVISCCSPQSFNGRADRISFDYNDEDFDDLVAKIPDGFVPDYFWEPQACGGSVPPYGINNAPFPTIAGICHTFRGPHAEALANYYDFVTPISTPFSEIFEQAGISARVLDVPVGGNWGSFNYTIWPDPGVKRSIDVLVNFSPSDFPEYGHYRKLVHQLCSGFKEKYGDKFNIVFQYGVNKLEYLDAMKRAKVVLNACGYNGPYNYRTFEAINCGAVVMQIETDFPVPQSLGDYLQKSKHYIEFSADDFETKLLTLLGDDIKRQGMSREAFFKLNTDLSYEAGQKKLSDLIRSVSEPEYKANRKEDYSCFLAWMKILSTSPVHYRHKRELFAKMAINSGLDDVDAIRFTIMSLPILANTRYGGSYINDIELKMMFERSLIDTIEHLYSLIPPQEIKLSDKWFFVCCQAVYGSTDIIAIESLMAEIEFSKTLGGGKAQRHQISFNDYVLFDLDLKDDEFVTLKKGALDMPYMTNLHNPEQKRALLPEFMQKSLQHFHRLAVKELRQHASSSNDSQIGYRRKLRA